MKQRIRKAGILLLGLMILFTIISRTAYNMSTAEVSTERAERQTFTPDVSARGTVTGSREIAVSTVENLRVGTVRVMEGQAVDAGEILFEVDLQAGKMPRWMRLWRSCRRHRRNIRTLRQNRRGMQGRRKKVSQAQASQAQISRARVSRVQVNQAQVSRARVSQIQVSQARVS